MRFLLTYLFLLSVPLSSVRALSYTSNPLPTVHFDWDAWLPRWFHHTSDFDFWQSAKDLGDKANIYKDKILKDAATEHASIANKINDFEKSIKQAVISAEALATMVLKHVPDREDFQSRFEVERSRAWETLKKEFSEPLPEDQTERYKQQTIRIARALEMTEDALVKVCGLPEADVRTSFDDIKPHISKALHIMVNLVNNHPVLIETLLFSAVLSIIPQSVILRPILSILGFGPSGPVKGSFATFAQRFFFGAAVTEGSWFAMLQRAGMKIPQTGVIRGIKCFFLGSC